jgi:hypothetical protein
VIWGGEDRCSGAVAVGVDTRVTWVQRSEHLVYWMVAGKDQQVVRELAVGMLRMVSGDDVRFLAQEMKRVTAGACEAWEKRSETWVIRGECTAEKVPVLETFTMLVNQ